jgi:hypothetical protein
MVEVQAAEAATAEVQVAAVEDLAAVAEDVNYL